MNISLYSVYYLEFVANKLREDGHKVILNQMSKDTEVCVVENRFLMYEIYQKLNFIKKNKIKLINLIADIPIWNLFKDFRYNNFKDYFRQLLYNYIHKNSLRVQLIDLLIKNLKNLPKNLLFYHFMDKYFKSQRNNRIFFQINYKNYLKKSDLNLSISRYTQKVVKRILNMDTELCYQCVNSDYLLKLPKTGIEYDAINISRIVPYKRQNLFIAAANKLNLKIIVLGKHVDKKIKLNCPHYYFEDFERVFNILSKSSFYVDPSIFEGFGMTPVEAAFLDKPVIASDTYVHRDVLGKYPLYFKRDNLKHLIEKMKYLINNDLKFDASKIKKKYSILSFKNRLLKYIEKVM